MKSLQLICLSFVAVTMSGLTNQSVQAEHPCYGLHGQHALGFNRLNANARVLPYFALYPPVYYSQSVPRPYGYSPFALPPGVLPVEPVAAPEVKSAMIINPFFRSSDEQNGKAADEVALKSKSKMIVNPFAPQPAAAANEQVAKNLKDRATSTND